MKVRAVLPRLLCWMLGHEIKWHTWTIGLQLESTTGGHMKVRAVVVWLVEPIYVDLSAQAKAPRRNKIEFNAVIEDARAMADQVIRDLGRHPENIGSGSETASELGAAMGNIIAQVRAATPQPTPGTRWHNGCVEFTTDKGQLLVIPCDRIAWIELGPEWEA